MNQSSKAKKGAGDRSRLPILRILELEKDEERPRLAVFALDDNLRPLATAEVDEAGRFDLSDDAIKGTTRYAIGPAGVDFGDIDRDLLTMYRPDQFLDRDRLDLGRLIWDQWLPYFRCTSGSLRHCHYLFPWPWLVSNQLAAAELRPGSRLSQAATLEVSGLERRSPLARRAVSDVATALDLSPIRIFPWLCHKLCNGVVEVYERTCCFKPWIVLDPRLPELLDRLEELVRQLPPIDIPQPDPPPFREIPFFKEGALDERALYARRDLAALRSLPPVEQAAYVQARPYLHGWWQCKPPVKVAETMIKPDGTFATCWLSSRDTVLCRRTYAYVIRQMVDGVWVTIYNGLAAGAWYGAGDNPTLTSYHPKARHCGNDYPGEGPFAMLEMIGATEAWNLKTPDATGWDRVGAPAYNDGLLFPASSPAAAVGEMLDCNLGGTLALRFAFSHELRNADPAGPAGPPRHYRVSISAANASGEPVGARTYFEAGLSWKKDDGGSTVSETLGPVPPATVGGQTNLYKIPYLQDADWLGTQFHAYIDTEATDEAGDPIYPEGRYLITLELFDQNGVQLKPAGTPGPGTDAPFVFQRWATETGPRPDVPYGALTHMFLWDNRPAKAEIVDFRVDGSPNTEECQFLVGEEDTMLSVGYRAYQPEPYVVIPNAPSFQLYHSLSWQRGLGGPSGYLEYENPNNVGMVAPAVSDDISFGDLLAGLPQDERRCTIALNLAVAVKTHNGSGRLSGKDRHATASFAVQIE